MSIDPGILMQVKSAPSAMQRAQTAAVSEKAGIIFYRFQGRPIKTTRPWCLEREGHVFHIEEIREWGRQAAAGNGWDGMVEGTNEQTVMTYLGGWYGDRSACRHVLIPVLPSRVPEEDMARMRAKGLIDVDLLQGPIPKPALEQKAKIDALQEINDAWTKAGDAADVAALHEELLADFNERVAPNLEGTWRSAIKTYTGSDFGPISGHLRAIARGEEGFANKPMLHSIEKMRSMLKSNPLTRDQVVFRGLRPGGGAAALVKMAKKTEPGTEMTFIGFTSTSIKIDPFFIKTAEVVMRILLPKGTQAAYIAGVSRHPKELEMLLNSGMRFKFLAFKTEGGKNYLDLEAIP